MAYILHIETSTKMCSVALSENGEYISHLNYQDEEGYAHSEKLTLLIKEILQKSGITIKQLKAISVSGGPGSYTGLRIGVSTAKGLCYSLGIPLIGIDSLACLNLWAKENYPEHNGLFLAMIDARRMEVFSLIQDSNLTIIKPISADILESDTYSTQIGNQPVLVSGDGADKTKDLWHHIPQLHYTGLIADARGQIKEAYRRFKQEAFDSLAYYEPFYLKDFIAGTKKG
jgi:tRNA threonylcarbamoyladenosine biosynthesis protein TsaB